MGVVNSTSSTLHSECGITETEYECPIPPDSACHMYMFTVTPVNVVGNGSASSKILTLCMRVCMCYVCVYVCACVHACMYCVLHVHQSML